ncbi:MAG TPA: twin-arginine translocase TatA/TatE family subunit [Opitutaceae bacterium]|nr:twin-arginine translocase TatA/TatE family subunit [Opitutaceae bacterium]
MVASHPALAILGLGTPEIILICFVILLLFGAKRLPDLARGIGKSVSEFKKAAADAEKDIRASVDEQPKTPPPTKPSATIPPPSSNN